MVARQQELASRGRIVVVGRDIGTVVLPDAPLKLYLVASIEERARRRWLELRDKGVRADLDEVLREMIRRDAHDGSRAHSPLRPADDAIMVDTTGRSAAEVVDAILSHDPV
jgi:cytidylate kinase